MTSWLGIIFTCMNGIPLRCNWTGSHSPRMFLMHFCHILSCSPCNKIKAAECSLICGWQRLWCHISLHRSSTDSLQMLANTGHQCPCLRVHTLLDAEKPSLLQNHDFDDCTFLMRSNGFQSKFRQNICQPNKHSQNYEFNRNISASNIEFTWKQLLEKLGLGVWTTAVGSWTLKIISAINFNLWDFLFPQGFQSNIMALLDKRISK